MCGIAGIFRSGDTPIEEERLLRMRSLQSHRGPDATGLRIGAHIGLAFNRLAILDLTQEANQPMATADGHVAIVFNGEIYNYAEIRKELESRGRRFRTQSDTEVILQGYCEWGLEVVPRLNGMFAMALWDEPRKTLHLIRDRVGKKPLHFCPRPGEIVFASEVGALLAGLDGVPELDPVALDRYLSYLCVPAEASIFRGIRKVPPASIVTCVGAEVTVTRYWRLHYRRKVEIDPEDALVRLEELLTDATRLRLMGDVPIGAFLSGGVDSSTVVALMSRLVPRVRTFSIGFGDSRYDESLYARAVAAACATQHTEQSVRPDAAAILPTLVWHYGEPFADPSAVPTYYVSAAARAMVTVALTGDGGDEGFAGYYWHRTLAIGDAYRRAVPTRMRALAAAVAAPWATHSGRYGSVARMLSAWGADGVRSPPWLWPGFRPEDKLSLYSASFRERLNQVDAEDYYRSVYASADGLTDLDRGLQTGIETLLCDQFLIKVDIASMACSLETRAPFLDYRVLEFAATLPRTVLLPQFRSKHLLKTLASRLVPPWTVYRRKQGFGVPISEWLRTSLRRPMMVLLTHPRAVARGYFDPAAVRNLLARHLAGEDHGSRIWTLLWLELWFRTFVDKDLDRGDSLHDLQ